MSENDRQLRWDQRYQQQSFKPGQPAYVLSANQHLLTTKGRALDIACGFGANALYLASLGYQVDAIDYSAVALEKLSEYARQNNLLVTTECTDLESFIAESAAYDVVVGSYYLQRNLFEKLFDCLKPGGLFFYQTFSGQPVNDNGPKNPAFRLQVGELIELCAEHSVLYYREDDGQCQISSDTICFNDEAMIVARKR